jgi:hypothetical protein
MSLKQVNGPHNPKAQPDLFLPEFSRGCSAAAGIYFGFIFEKL